MQFFFLLLSRACLWVFVCVHLVWTFLLVPDLIQSFRFVFSWICLFPSQTFIRFRSDGCASRASATFNSTLVCVVILISIRYSRISNFSFSWSAERKRNSYSMHRFIIIYKIIETRLCCTQHVQWRSRMYLRFFLFGDSSFTCWRRTKWAKN